MSLISRLTSPTSENFLSFFYAYYPWSWSFQSIMDTLETSLGPFALFLSLFHCAGAFMWSSSTGTLTSLWSILLVRISTELWFDMLCFSFLPFRIVFFFFFSALSLCWIPLLYLALSSPLSRLCSQEMLISLDTFIAILLSSLSIFHESLSSMSLL